MAIDKALLDQLLAGRDPQELFAKGGLIDDLKKAGLVAYSCRSDFSFRLLGVRKPGGFCLLTLNACGAGYRSR
jgi:hypothetical protein